MHLKLLFALSMLRASSYGLPDDSTNDASAAIDQKWNDFKAKFGKSYEDSPEEMHRRNIFTKNLKVIDSHNELYSKGLKSYSTGINQFHDMEEWEFNETVACVNINDYYVGTNLTMLEGNSKTLPKEVDWRTRGYVTPVKDQGRCGSCWAFAATGALEAHNVRKNGQLVSLSEQNLIDCSWDFRNDGCGGGTPRRAFAYVSENGGINTEASYPYSGTNGTCRYQSNSVGGTCNGYAYVFGENNLQTAIANVGPVAEIMVVTDTFKSYQGGIYDDDNCFGIFNHAVLVVGYGTDSSSGQDYWIIKNSWNTTWGMDGYAFVVRNKQMCGFGQLATYPFVYTEQEVIAETTTVNAVACKSSYERASLKTVLLFSLIQFLFIYTSCMWSEKGEMKIQK